ncbi:MAG TPA: hypothetical protein PLD27_00795 [bacterium]|nr:hypothetical protein [bacterium]HOL46909.1 hypothetical protein [bacterium]HPQ18329.1 hypothetical protein [bacterium]
MFFHKIIKNNFFYLFLLFTIFLFFYSFNLTKNYSFDSIGFLFAIRENILFQIFHSYHLIFLPIQILFLKIFKPDNQLLFLQIINSLIANFSILIFFLIIEKITKNKLCAFLISLLSGTTLWHFKYAVDLEVHSYNAFIISLLFLNLLYLNSKNIFLLAIIFAIAVLFHQINIFILPTIIFALIYRKLSIKKIFYFFIISFSIIGFSYFFIGYFFLKLNTIIKFYKWLTYYQQLGYWGGFSLQTFSDTINGFAQSFIGKGNNKIFLFYFFIFLLLFIFVKNIKNFFANYFYELGIFFFWFIFQSAVVIYWHPLNIENWLSQLAIWLPAAIILNFLITQKKIKIIYGILLIAFILNFFNIYKYYIYPNKFEEKSINLVIIKKIKNEVKANENLIISGEGEYANLTIYIKYFLPEIKLYSIDEILVENKSDFNIMVNKINSITDGWILSDVFNNFEPLLNKHKISKSNYLNFVDKILTTIEIKKKIKIKEWLEIIAFNKK